MSKDWFYLFKGRRGLFPKMWILQDIEVNGVYWTLPVHFFTGCPGCFAGTQRSWAFATKTSKPKIIPISRFPEQVAGHQFWVSPFFNLRSLSLKNKGVKNLRVSCHLKSLQLQNSLLFLKLRLQKCIGSKERQRAEGRFYRLQMLGVRYQEDIVDILRSACVCSENLSHALLHWRH